MEIIIIITKEVEDETAAHNFAVKVKGFVANNSDLNDPSVRVQMESREQINPG